MTGVERFENAIIDFGIDAAFEYFATPIEVQKEFMELKRKECAPSYNKDYAAALELFYEWHDSKCFIDTFEDWLKERLDQQS